MTLEFFTTIFDFPLVAAGYVDLSKEKLGSEEAYFYKTLERTDDNSDVAMILGIFHMSQDLIEDEALDELARLSSGIPRQLVILVRQACLEALKKDQAVIDAATVHAAANQQRNEYEVLLDRSQRELLREVRERKDINNDEAHRALLHNLSVLQYQNDDVWYDVHPIVLPLIETNDASA